MKEKIGLKSKQLWQNQEYREKVIKNSLKGLRKRPTLLEKKMIELIEIHKLPFTYCGDGSLLVGFKNPDFVENNDKNLCIEVANRFHHQGNWKEGRVNHFKKYGWKCLVIWWDEIFSDKYGKVECPQWQENILNKIKNFISSS
jgi:very-short-patch-repair endonuclease